MKDMLGEELFKGDFVAYGARSGNTGQLKLGIITDTEKQTIVTASANYRTYRDGVQLEEKEYYIECSGVQGRGIDGDKLLKIDKHFHPNEYALIYEKAKKYL
jgi:hypothetical protein